MTIRNDYHLEQFVWLITDTDQVKRMITAIQVQIGNVIKYRLSCGEEYSWHFACEISDEEDTALKTSN